MTSSSSPQVRFRPMRFDRARIGDTIYTSNFTPDHSSARDVLAFVLTPAESFAPQGGMELEEVKEIFAAAKAEAIQRWQASRPRTTSPSVLRRKRHS